MPSAGINRRPAFDPRLSYVAGPRGVRLGGVTYPPGHPVDPSVVDSRRMRQLYERLHIVLAPGQQILAPPTRLRAIGHTVDDPPAPPPRPSGVPRQRSRRAA